MYGILQFMPRGLRNCANCRYSFPVINSYPNKILVHCNDFKDIANNRRYFTQIISNYKNASSSFMAITRTHTRKRLRKWKYVLGLGGLLGGIFFYYTSEDDYDEHADRGLCTPSKPSDITKNWIEYMLTEYESRNSKGSNVIVKSFEMNNAIKPGEGFNSQLLKLDVHACVQNLPGVGSTSFNKEYNLIIKMPKLGDAMGREMHRLIGVELREQTIYSEVIPELNKFQESYGNEFGIKVPGFLYGKLTNKESVLVIENAKPAGYKPHSVKYELDLNHAKVVVENLAKLHAVSYSYNKTHNFLDKFPCIKGEGIMNWFNSCNPTDAVFETVIKLLELKNDKDFKKLTVKIKNSKAKLDKKLRDVVRDDSSKYVLCLTHGDCHNSNLLFRYGEDIKGNQAIDDIKFIDWQLTNWNSPIMDLQYFLTISTTHKFRKAHLETLLQRYHSTFTQATTKMNTPVPHWTYEQFKEEYERFAVFGLVRGLVVILFIFSKYAESTQVGMLEESSHGNPRIERLCSKLCKHLWYKTYTSPTYEKIAIKIFTIMIYFIGREIVNGTNPLLNDRILGLVLDANEQGLFDDGSLNQTI